MKEKCSMNEKKEKEEIVKRDRRRRFKRTGKKWKLGKPANGKLLKRIREIVKFGDRRED